MHDSTLLTVTAFCERAGIDRRTWDLLRAQGRAPANAKVDGRIMISAEDADEWLRSQERAA